MGKTVSQPVFSLTIVSVERAYLDEQSVCSAEIPAKSLDSRRFDKTEFPNIPALEIIVAINS